MYREAVRQFRKQLIEQELAKVQGNRARTARTLGLDREYLYRLIKALGINVSPTHPLARPGPVRPGKPSHAP